MHLNPSPGKKSLLSCVIVLETSVHPHIPEERADLFGAFDSQTTEVEYLELLSSLARVLKPQCVLETGTFMGHATAVLASTCRRNSRGFVTSIEMDPTRANAAANCIKELGLENWCEIVCNVSVDWILAAARREHPKFDLAFFDSDLPVRVREFRACMDTGLLRRGSVALFHDSSRARTTRDGGHDKRADDFWKDITIAIREYRITNIMEFPLSRGLLMLKMP